MACRQTGFALLCSGSVQEAHDLACIAHAATLEARVPFLHFFDGFRTSHEERKIDAARDDDLRALIDERRWSRRIAPRALTPDRPVLRGTARTPTRSSRRARPRTASTTPARASSQRAMDRFARAHGPALPAVRLRRPPRGRARDRDHGLGRGDGARDGRVAARRAARRSACSRSGSTGRSRSPPSSRRCRATVRALAVLDRTKEPGAVGEPLYLDVVAALREAGAAGAATAGGGGRALRAGRRRSSPRPWCRAVFDELRAARRRATTSPSASSTTSRTPRSPVDADFDIERETRTRAVFFGLGADGTVGANKNSIKIIGEETDHDAQGYFVYDSKKSGAVTISHLRFGPRPIRSSYLIRRASFVACHQFELLDRFDVLEAAAPGRRLPAERALRAGRGVGAPAARGAGRDRRRSGCELLRDRRLPGGARGRARRPHQHRSCRPASSPSPACCRATRRSRASSRPSSAPTARRAPRSCGGTSPRSTRRWPHLHEVPVPAAVTRDARPPADRRAERRPTSCSASPR